MLDELRIDYVFHFDGRGRTARTDHADHVRDMIEQLLMTETGERVNRPDFGCSLRQLVFGPNSPELASALQFTIGAALSRWLGDVIEVRGLEVSALDAALTIDLRYALRDTGEEQTARFVRSA